MKHYLEQLATGNRLTSHETLEVFETMFSGKLSPVEISGFLCLWRAMGESEVELTAGAQVMRRHAVSVDLGEGVRPLMDNCGTGGDGSNSFNISTASAIVAASMGITVAKHGNRSVSSRCGSADLLFEAGVDDSLPQDKVVEALETKGFAFFFAPSFHPVMKEVMPVRKELGIRTIFNLLGPLANPVKPEMQVIGVGHNRYLDPMVKAAKELGMQRAAVVHSHDGLDEVSPESVTDVRLLIDGEIKSFEVNPEEMGVTATMNDLTGGDPKHNYQMLLELFEAKKGPLAETIALNVAPILMLSGKAGGFKIGYQMAYDAILSGKPKVFFDDWLTLVGRRN